jgi:selenocysteine-specific elongation factor
VHVVATAGHVDHGKSTLVKALTGVDPDRLAEEKERGLTIDLGFAGATLPSGRGVAFVDVPGHIRFLKNMLAGVGTIDACMFVVAASEGWKAQSEEHLRILELLGLQRALLVLTRARSVPGDRLARARADVALHVAGSFLEPAEVVEVDVPAGHGVEDLRGALDRLLEGTPTAPDQGRPRLWVDRSFAAVGAGTVVTGTLAGGSLRVGDEVEIVPGAGRARIRGLQSLHQRFDELRPGHRAAVNLVGVGHGAVGRGSAVVQPGRWHLTDRFDASLEVLAGVGHAVSRRGAHMLHVGAGEHHVRIRVLGDRAIEAGDRGLVRVHLPVALPLLPGDRYVLRDAGRSLTVGGGEVLDVAPLLPAARARPDRSVDRVVAEHGWIDADALERLTGVRRTPTVARWVVAPAALAATTRRIGEAVERAGPLGLDLAALDERERAALRLVEHVVVDGGRARPADRADPLQGHPYLRALEQAPYAPPSPEDAGASRAEVRQLVRRGLVVERDDVFFAGSAVASAARVVADLLSQAPEGVTVAEVRDALGCTRRHAVPLLGALDAAGVTRRRGDVRVAGPRLPVR